MYLHIIGHLSVPWAKQSLLASTVLFGYLTNGAAACSSLDQGGGGGDLGRVNYFPQAGWNDSGLLIQILQVRFSFSHYIFLGYFIVQVWRGLGTNLPDNAL